MLRPGFRKVVFSVAIMCIVLFYQKGIMGEKEFSVAGIINYLKRIKSKIIKNKKHVVIDK
jgi:branched-chain amino acid transport system permease protein